MSKELNEFLTRKQRIDVMLKEQGWVVGDRTKVIVEVDTKQSDFLAQNYKTVSETLKNDMDSKYVDYMLPDSAGAPLAIVEAKRTSKDPILTAQKQAEEYANDIKTQTGKDVFIFLSNGYEIWFWYRRTIWENFTGCMATKYQIRTPGRCYGVLSTDTTLSPQW